jgi:hypothetical protein
MVVRKDLLLATIDAQKMNEGSLVTRHGKQTSKRSKRKNASMQSAVSTPTITTITNIDKPQNN